MGDNLRGTSALTLKEVLNELASLNREIIIIKNSKEFLEKDIERLKMEFYGVNSIQTKIELMRVIIDNIKVILDKEVAEREKRIVDNKNRNWQVLLLIVTTILSLGISIVGTIIQFSLKKG